MHRSQSSKRSISLLIAFLFIFGALFAATTQTSWAAAKPGKVKISSIAEKTTTTATVKWNAVSKANGYQIRYSASSSMKNAKTLTAASGKTTSKKISKLASGKKYYVQVRAYKKSGSKKVYGAWSAKKNFTTYPLKKVKIYSITNLTTEALVSWDTVQNASGYQIRFSASSSMAQAKVLTETDYPYRWLTNLASGKKYYVQVRAYKKSGSKKVYGAWSAKKSFTTQYTIKYVDNLDQYKISCYMRYTDTENPASYTSADSITLKNPTCLSYCNGYRTLYLFDGWYSDKACTQQVTKIAKGTKGNLVFYAKWKPVIFNVTYVLNDSEDAPAQAADNPSTYRYGEDCPLAAPSRPGYVFQGWYIEPYSSSIIENFNDDIAYQDLTLCAKWKAIGTGTISYNVNFKAAWELAMETLDTSASSEYPYYEAGNSSTGSYPIKYHYLLKEGSGTGYSGEPLLQPSLPNADFVGWEVTYCSTSDFTTGQIINAIPKGFSGRLLQLQAVYSDPGLEACRKEILNDTTKNDLEKVKAWARELTYGYYTYGSYRDLTLEEYTALSDKYISLYGFFNHGTCFSGAIDIKEFCDDLGLRCVLRFAGNDTIPGKNYGNGNTDHRNTYVWYGGKRYCIGSTPGGSSEQFEVTEDLIQYLPDYYDYED